MTTPVTIQSAHTVVLKYLGPTNYRPSRIVATWEGWPSDGSKPIRRVVSRDYSTNCYATWAADKFVEWLNTLDDDKYTHTLMSVVKGSLARDRDVLLIKTHYSTAA